MGAVERLIFYCFQLLLGEDVHREARTMRIFGPKEEESPFVYVLLLWCPYLEESSWLEELGLSLVEGSGRGKRYGS